MADPLEEIHLLNPQERDAGLGVGAAVSLVLHVAILALLLSRYAPVATQAASPVRYVELMSAAPPQPQQQPQPSAAARRFTEAPGPKLDQAPPESRLLSDANRRASTPSPTGSERTNKPGLTDAPFVPGRPPGPPPGRPAGQQQESSSGNPDTATAASRGGFEYRVGGKNSESENVDWRSAIRDAGKVASIGGDIGNYGGDAGFAENGPISFETSWFDWGEYAQSMVTKIRYHWYANMPSLIRMGVRGVAVVRFTITRSGAIRDVELVKSSGHPPYDFAAKKSIELSSPLNALPANFPNESERVTAQFFYNMRPPN